MDWNHIKNNWISVKPMFRTKWTTLTDDDLKDIDGRREKLAEVLARRHGRSPEQAEAEIAAFERTLKSPGQACG